MAWAISRATRTASCTSASPTKTQRLDALTGADLVAATRTYMHRPTVIGHLSPNASPPRGNSQKSSAEASDDFSKRIPNGPIVEPSWIAKSVATPTTARSKLAPVEFTLSNGLHVIVQRKTDRPTVVIKGSIASSPAFAPAGKEGIIRLASSAADYGSTNYPFAQRRKATDEMGVFVTTGQDFSAQAEVRDFNRVVAILADGEAHPSFEDPWLSIERSQLANSLQSEGRISGVMIDRAYDRLLLADTDPSLRQPTAESVGGITRTDLLNYTATYWRPDLTTIAVVGDIPPEAVRTALEASFGTWNASGPKPDPHLMAMPPAASGHDYIGTAANQVYIRLGQPALSRSSADYDTFAVLNQILGAGGAFESRLWQELRQKRGLVYSVNSTLEADGDRGDLRVELNASPQRVVAAVTLVRQELKRLQEEPVTQTELQEAKVRLVSNALLEESSSSGQAKQILDIADNRLPLDYYSTLNERYERITAADVQRVAREYLHPDRLVEVYCGALGPVGGAHAMIETIDPATGEVLERIEPMSPERIEAKLAAAARAFEGWRATSFDRRADLLQGVAARFRDERERLAATAVREMGKPLVQARAEVDKCAWALDYFAEHGEALLAAQPAESTGTRSYVAFRPLGALLAIMPWNFPFWQVIRAAAPAMMAGNVLLLKHASNTTRCALGDRARL